jgi:hypothetical protein
VGTAGLLAPYLGEIRLYKPRDAAAWT